MKQSKKAEIQKQINFIFKDFKFDQASNIYIQNAHDLLGAYEYNKDIEFYDIEDDHTNKKIIIKIKPFNDENMVFIINDDGK